MGSKYLKWSDKLANELHRPVVKHFRKREVIVNGIDEIWAADLVDMQSFSKNSSNLQEGKCQKIWVDKGLEFYIRHVKALGVELYSTENEEKNENTKHFSIKITPVEASDKKNENIVWFNLNGNARSESVRPKFSIGDRFTDPPTYKLTDDNKEEIQGTFYEQELQKTDQNIFRIEKVIRKLKNKSLVKWYGYPESFNSWVDNKELISLI
ncbi:uncharacterized protein LOC136086146 [Hydra vulgaris]|uniref:Uncharacterized protein LOC136086146 n=1 Tax=Hydra vulgaris TaxID=6087 RepID=A0ABM4CRL7_HYDVU